MGGVKSLLTNVNKKMVFFNEGFPNELCSMPPSWAPPDINIMPGESCVLHNIFEADSKAYNNKHLVDYQKCLNLFLHNENELVRSSISAASNGQDHLGNTPLHLAGDTHNSEASRWLIRCGARLNIKNDMELNPYVPPDVMREFLDSCIRDH